MKILLLCFLLSFQLLAATSKTKTTASIAGGYVTSLNKFDGSFEEGITNFTVSTGTLTQATDSTMEGYKVGSWVTTAAGTLDTIAMTVSATNTYELSYQVVTSDPANTYVCAVVNTVENACKLLGGMTTVQKASWIGSLNTNDSVKIRVKYIGTSATIKVDDFKNEPFTYQVAGLEEKQTYTIQQSGSAMTARTAVVEFNLATSTIQNMGMSLILASSVSGDTRFIAQKETHITGTIRGEIADAGYGIIVRRYNSSGTLLMNYLGSQVNLGTYNEENTFELFLSTGDYFIVDIALRGKL